MQRLLRRHSRRASLIAMLFAVLSLETLQPAPARADDAAVEFMQRVAKDLQVAARSNSAQAFADAINKHGHVPAIGLYALGTFKPRLQPADRAIYYSGMVRFLARYAASKSQKYAFSHAEIKGPSSRTDAGVFVESRVHLRDGSSYDVRWQLFPQGNAYRIRDAEVLTFWLSPFLKNFFETYISDNGGDPKALIVALNR